LSQSLVSTIALMKLDILVLFYQEKRTKSKKTMPENFKFLSGNSHQIIKLFFLPKLNYIAPNFLYIKS